MKATQFFIGRKIDGVLRIPAGVVDASATRGIKYHRPERYVVNTPFGQLEITDGDWVLRYQSGNLYVMKDADFIGKTDRIRSTSWLAKRIRDIVS